RIGEKYLAAADTGGTRQDAHDRLADHRLAGAGLADQCDGTALAHPERDAAHGVDRPAVDLERHLEILDVAEIGHDAPLTRAASASWARIKPSAARFASVVSSVARRLSRSARAARAAMASKPSILESTAMVVAPADSFNVIQPPERLRRVE